MSDDSRVINHKVSIIISNYQGMEYLPECLRCLSVQTYENYEIIVVDSGSTDGSKEFIKHNYPEIRLIECDRIGLGAAINIGIQNSTGDIICFDVNTDEFVFVNWLEELIEQLKRFDYNIITGATRIIYGTNLIDEAGVRLNLRGLAKKLGHNKTIDSFEFPVKPVDYVGAPIFHRKLLNKIGLIDEGYYIYAEELDFCYRAKLIGIKTYCAPKARSYHHIRATIGKNTRQFEYFLRRAQTRFQIIYSNPFKMMLSLFYICFFLTFAAFIGSISCSKNSCVYYEKFLGRVRALWWISKNIRESSRRRRQINYFKRSNNVKSTNLK